MLKYFVLLLGLNSMLPEKAELFQWPRTAGSSFLKIIHSI